MNFSKEDLAGMFNNADFSDIQLIANDDQKFFACKKVLKSTCPFFALGGRLKNKDELKLDLRGQILQEVLRWIYLKDVQLNGFTAEDHQELTQAALKYGLRGLQVRCATSIQMVQADINDTLSNTYQFVDIGANASYFEGTKDDHKDPQTQQTSYFSQSSNHKASDFKRGVSIEGETVVTQSFEEEQIQGEIHKERSTKKTKEEDKVYVNSKYFSDQRFRSGSRRESDTFFNFARMIEESEFFVPENCQIQRPTIQNQLHLDNIQLICSWSNVNQNSFSSLLGSNGFLQVEKSTSMYFNVRLKKPILVDVICWNTKWSQVLKVKVFTHDEKWTDFYETHGADFVDLGRPLKIIEVYFGYSGQVLEINSLQAGLKL